MAIFCCRDLLYLWHPAPRSSHLELPVVCPTAVARNLAFLGRPKCWPFYQYLAGPPASEDRRIDALSLYHGVCWRFNSLNILVTPQISQGSLYSFSKLGRMEFDKPIILRGIRNSVRFIGW